MLTYGANNLTVLSTPQGSTDLKHAFIIYTELPDGVPASEFANHLADAHRAMVRGYHLDDPMSRAGEIVIEPVTVSMPARGVAERAAAVAAFVAVALCPSVLSFLPI